MANGNDYMAHLPKELSTYILSFLDIKSVLACSGVNKSWNEITNCVSSTAWHKACLKAGIYVRRDKYTDAEDWKAFLSSMLKRLEDMQDSACFSITHYEFDEPVTAIYCHNENVAVAFVNRVGIWNLAENTAFREFQCNFEPLHLKFDDHILAAASRSGAMCCWSFISGYQLWYFTAEHPGVITLTSFDFLSQRDIITGSFCSKSPNGKYISIWSVSSNSVIRERSLHRCNILRVMLATHPEHPVDEQENTYCLFSLSTDLLLTWTVELKNREFSAHVMKSLNLISGSLLSDSYSRLDTFLMYKSPRVLAFDGETLYYLSPFCETRNCFIGTWNMITGCRKHFEPCGQTTRLLGVGGKYLVYEIRAREDFELVVAADKVSGEIISYVYVPRRNLLTDDDHLCLGNTAWLDGINGENDRGIVYASVTDDKLGVYAVQFSPRSR